MANKKNKVVKEKTNRKRSLFLPQNLKREIEGYGYSFSYKKYAAYFALAALAIIVIARLFALNLTFSIILFALSIAFVPFFVRDSYMQKKAEDEYIDATKYVENMLYSFMNTKKILESLRDVSQLYETGELKECIAKAIAYIEQGDYKEEAYSEALAIIERKFPSKRIANAHNLMIAAELYGGDFEGSARILLEDKKKWVNNTNVMRVEKKKKYKELALSAIASGALCAIITIVYNKLPGNINITNNVVVQGCAVITMFLLLLIAKRGSTKLNTDWVKEDSLNKSSNSVEKYNELLSYDAKKENIKSLIFSSIFFVGAIVTGVLRIKVAAIILGIIGLFVLLSSRLGYKVLYRSVKNEVMLALPAWFVQLTLLLQENNIKNALTKSMATAPEIIKPELTRLLERTDANPNDINAYTDFFAFFDIPEINSAMQVLYMVGVTGSGNTSKQMQSLLDTIYVIQENAEKIEANENILGLSNMFKYPMLVGSAKLIVDLVMFILVALPAMMSI